ncbi:MAG: mannose-1-phosphate guanylyltransferase [Fibrobacteraceae bacterium]|nr:mannose-1-phosphate guanylyltransferase [Fibrobacteraceae bacterium]
MNHLVIMAGGIGSRFWPMSTAECPKQFIDIIGCGRTMIQQTFDRFSSIIPIERVWVVTSANYQAIVANQLKGIDPQHILLEPCMRNTAPCIAYVSAKIAKEDAEAVMVVSPSDHLVTDVKTFEKAINRGLRYVENGNVILTLGMNPTRPETGYGYIQSGEKIDDSSDMPIFKLHAFKEKPNLETAKTYLAEGGYTWNSGLFLWSVKTILSELRNYAPQIMSVIDKMQPSFFTEKEQETVNHNFPSCEKISIDYAVMEKTSLASVLPIEFGWSDLGTWGSLHTLITKDENNNAVIGNAVKMVDANGCMVRMPKDKKVVIQGIDNCIVVENNGTLLICKLEDEQRIKDWHN